MMNSTHSSSEVVQNALDKAEYVWGIIASRFVELWNDVAGGKNQLNKKFLRTYKKSCKKELNDLEDMVFAVTLNPDLGDDAERVETIYNDMVDFLNWTVDMFDYYCIPPDDRGEPQLTPQQIEEERKKRTERIEKFLKGEHL
jgi:hypothetical protein